MQEPILESIRTDIAVVRASFITQELFHPDDPILEELRTMISDARQNLLTRLRHIASLSPRDIAPEFHTTNEGFRYWALALATKGYPRPNLDSMLKTDVFRSVAAADGDPDCTELMYLYKFSPPIDLPAAAKVPAAEVFQLIITDLIRSAEESVHFSSKRLFDCHVYQKSAAFVFAHFAGADQYYFGD